MGQHASAHIVGAHATELIHELAVARENEYASRRSRWPSTHPTLSEAIAEAVLDAMGWVIHA